jgi:hypothetical protein
MHSFGTIHFLKPKRNQPMSSSQIIIDSQWLADIFATIVTANQFVKNGTLQYGDLQRIWGGPKFPDHLYPNLVDILVKFEAIFPVYSKNLTDGSFIVPSLLPKQIPYKIKQVSSPFFCSCFFSFLLSLYLTCKTWPQFPRSTEVELCRKFQFRFLPRGFFSRLMVRSLPLGTSPVFYRDGILFKMNNNTELSHSGNYSLTTENENDYDMVLIDYNETSHIISASVRGTRPTATYCLILEHIFNFLKDCDWQLEYSSFVVCPHCLKSHSFEPTIFPIQMCEDAVLSGQVRLLKEGVNNYSFGLISR